MMTPTYVNSIVILPNYIMYVETLRNGNMWLDTANFYTPLWVLLKQPIDLGKGILTVCNLVKVIVCHIGTQVLLIIRNLLNK